MTELGPSPVQFVGGNSFYTKFQESGLNEQHASIPYFSLGPSAFARLPVTALRRDLAVALAEAGTPSARQPSLTLGPLIRCAILLRFAPHRSGRAGVCR